MKFRSAWSRGLVYGGLFGGAIAAFPIIGSFFTQANPVEVLLVGGTIALIWGTLGFLAGFASHSEQPIDSVASQPSLFRRLLYRFVAGLLLSYIFAAILGAILLAPFLMWIVVFPEPPKGANFKLEQHLAFIVFCLYCGTQGGACVGSFLGAMLARGGNILKPIAKVAFFTSMSAVLPGAWLGALTGVAWFNRWGFDDTGPIVAAVAGALAGVATAIVVRLAVFR